MQNARKSLFFAMVLALIGPFSSSRASDGMISQWKFDEGSGTTAYDSVGDNHGTIYGAQWATGIFDGALSFEVVNDYIDVGNNASLKMTDGLTISVWINMASFYTALYQNIISDHGPNEVTEGPGKILRFHNKTLQFIVGGIYGWGTAIYTKYTFADTMLGQWQHVVGTYDRNTVRLYLNGEEVDSRLYTAPLTVNTNPILIGKSGFGEYLRGIVDDVCIYDRALTKEEIQAHLSSFVETSSSESTSIETLTAQEAVLENGTVSGDFDSTFDFTGFEVVSISTGPWAGKGFSKGQCETTLEGIPYTGDWTGVIFLKPEERKIYLKGAMSGGISATVEGYLTESVPESDIYDRYQATWKIGRLGDTTTSAIINLSGNLTYQSSSEFPGTELYLLQTNIEGTLYGHYSGPLSTVINHIRITEADNPYHGEGFSIISYVSDAGSGQGWTYDNLASPMQLKGMFTSPLFGVVFGTLDESQSPRTLSLGISRVDLGLPPAPELKINIWGPGRVSPGQTVNYVIEYRNDGLKAADDVLIFSSLDPLVEYGSASEGAFYDEWSHAVGWSLFRVGPKTNGYLSSKAYIPWGLPFGTTLSYSSSIANIELHSDTHNGIFGNGVGAFPGNSGWPLLEQKKCEKYASERNLDWIEAFQGGIVQDRLDVFKAYRGEPTETNRLSDPRLIGEYDEVHAFSGFTTVVIRKILNGDLKVKKRLRLISGFWFSQYDPEPEPDVWKVVDKLYEKLREKYPDVKIEIWQSDKDRLPLGFWQHNQIKILKTEEEKRKDWLNVVRKDGLGHFDLFNAANNEEKEEGDTTSSGVTNIAVARDPNRKFGPEGPVSPGEQLNYKVEYENEGEGIAFGVYFTDTLDGDLDDSTLEIGPVLDVSDGSVIAEPGIYNPDTRTITWFVGEVGPGQGGYAEFSVNVRADAEKGTEIINFAIVYFPSVPEVTRTNGIVSIVPVSPEIEIIVPQANAALQDGVTLTAEASDISVVDEVYFYVREPGGGNGVPIGYEDLSATLNETTGQWEYAFDTTQLSDGYYVILAKAVDTYGNEAWSEVVPFSIRNWAVLELLPASESNKAGRTMPVKFSLRIVESVDPAMPFVYNEELEVKIYDSADPGTILQTSLYGQTSRDYRIDSVEELYITNFKTKKQPAEYVVEIWRISKNFLVGSFTFETVQ